MGAMSGGAKLTKYLDDQQRKVAQGALLRVGFLEGAMHPSKSPNGEAVSVAQVAAWNEWGDPEKGRVPRPFFRNMVGAKKGGWGRSMGNILQANGGNIIGALELMGEGIKNQLQRSINEFTDPPLRPSTIARKGFDKPLIESADMLRAAAWEVKTGESEESGDSHEPT